MAGATKIAPASNVHSLSQAVRMDDTLMNLVTGMGTDRDKLQGTVFKYSSLMKDQLDSAYRGDWIARKIIDIPAFDSFREWRRWEADKNDITKLEGVEKQFQIRRKAMMALMRGRLYGGGALVMGVDQGRSEDELDFKRLGKDCLKFLHVVNRHEIQVSEIEWDILSPYYGQPKFYTQTPQGGGMPIKLHPSRVVRFVGAESTDLNSSQGWGDSMLQVCADAVIAASSVSQTVAQLVQEAKLDIVKVPELSEKILNQGYEDRLKKRFALANTMKSIYGVLIVDAEEVWERLDQDFTGLPDVLKMYLMIACGAADIPATRFLSQSPTGLSATGESDTRNYYDRLSTEQNVVVSPAMEPLDKVLMASALGSVPEELFYVWNPLWQATEKEKAEIGKIKADIMTADVNAGLITPLVLQKARENQLIEDGLYPGLESLIDDFGDDIDAREPEVDPNENEPVIDPDTGKPMEQPPKAANQNVPPKPPKAAANDAEDYNENHDPATGEFTSGSGGGGGGKVAFNVGKNGTSLEQKRIAAATMYGKGSKKYLAAKKKYGFKDADDFDDSGARPRTLYMHRDVLNRREIAAHFRKQGFKTVVKDLHVTVIYSKTPVDWLKIGNDWQNGREDGTMTVQPGGPRVMEKFGKALVMAFSNSDLAWRWRSAIDRGASSDYEDYTPHITISYNLPEGVDFEDIEPWPGKIELGPEIFEEIKTGFNNETDVVEDHLPDYIMDATAHGPGGKFKSRSGVSLTTASPHASGFIYAEDVPADMVNEIEEGITRLQVRRKTPVPSKDKWAVVARVHNSRAKK